MVEARTQTLERPGLTAGLGVAEATAQRAMLQACCVLHQHTFLSSQPGKEVSREQGGPCCLG